MEFLQTIRNAIHGWSEETRKFFAMLTMGIGLLVFFSLWISSVSSRLVAIGPSVSGPSAPQAPTPESLPTPTAFLPSQDNLGAETPPDIQPYAPLAPVAQNPAQSPSASPLQPASERAPTPIQGVAETFGGLNQLFSRATEQPSDMIVGRLRSVGAWLWGIALNLFSRAQNFLLWIGGWVYQRISTLIAS